MRNRTDIVPPDSKDEKKKGDGTNLFVNEMRQRIDDYFHIVVRCVRDLVPKTIGHNLVRGSQEKL
jgi:hypothetical protein